MTMIEKRHAIRLSPDDINNYITPTYLISVFKTLSLYQSSLHIGIEKLSSIQSPNINMQFPRLLFLMAQIIATLSAPLNQSQ